MIWTKRRLLIAVAMSDTLTSKRFFELYERLNEDVSLNDTFVLGDLKYALPEETSQWIESMDWDVEIKRLQEKRVKVFDRFGRWLSPTIKRNLFTSYCIIL